MNLRVIFILIVLIFSFWIYTNEAEEPEIKVSTQIYIYGVGEAKGGGYLTWYLTGKTAYDLRNKLIDKYDGIVDTTTKNERLDLEEVNRYIGNEGSVELWLRPRLLAVTYWGVKIFGFRPYHHKEEPLSVDVTGLIEEDRYSTKDIKIDWYFDCKLYEGSSKTNISTDIFVRALYESINETIPYTKCKLSHTQYMFGFQSIRHIKHDKGKLLVIRTPIGVICKYDLTYTQLSPTHTAEISTFNLLENPLLIFIILLVLTWIAFTLVGHIYENYRRRCLSAHTTITKIWYVHVLMYILYGLAFVFYFFPCIGSIFISGSLYWIFLISIFVVSVCVGVWVYKREIANIPHEPRTLLEERVRVPYPSQPLPESEVIPEPEIIEQIEIELGYNYLIFEEVPTKTYMMVAEAIAQGVPCLCVSTTFPPKLRREHNLQDVTIIWLSRSSDPYAVDPKRLEFEILRDISNFMKNNKGIVVIDGIEYIIVENGFEKVFQFIKKVCDLSSIQKCSLLVTVNPSSLDSNSIMMLKKEFDKIQDFFV